MYWCSLKLYTAEISLALIILDGYQSSKLERCRHDFEFPVGDISSTVVHWIDIGMHWCSLKLYTAEMKPCTDNPWWVPKLYIGEVQACTDVLWWGPKSYISKIHACIDLPYCVSSTVGAGMQRRNVLTRICTSPAGMSGIMWTLSEIFQNYAISRHRSKILFWVNWWHLQWATKVLHPL